MTDLIKDFVGELIVYFKEHTSLLTAQYSYKLEEWAAVETFCFFRQRLTGWYVSSGSLPYLSTEHQKEDKWSDVYARKVEDGKAVAHLWIEFKAVPIYATSRRKTLGDFEKDILCLWGLERDSTVKFWKNQINPRTGKKQVAWFKKLTAPGSIVEGRFLGVAILLIGIRNEDELTLIQKNLSNVLSKTSSILIFKDKRLCESSYEEGSLGCLAYEVPIRQ